MKSDALEPVFDIHSGAVDDYGFSSVGIAPADGGRNLPPYAAHATFKEQDSPLHPGAPGGYWGSPESAIANRYFGPIASYKAWLI